MNTRIKQLEKELKVAKIISEQRDGRAAYAFSVAEHYWKQYHACRRALVRSRLLVKEFKQAIADQEAQKVIRFDIKPDRDEGD